MHDDIDPAIALAGLDREARPKRDARLRDDVLAKDLADMRAGRRHFAAGYEAHLERYEATL